jgi:hypothetical protein
MRRPQIPAAALVALAAVAALVAPTGPAYPLASPTPPGEWTRGAPQTAVNLGVGALAISPTDADVVYAALGNGVARTTDGGATWAHLGVDEGFGDSFALDSQVLVDPSSPQRVFAASYSGVRRSSDGGDHFSDVGTTGGLGSIVRGIAVDAGAGPADTRVLATGYVQKVALSTDSGTTWVDKTGNAAAAGLGLGAAAVLLHPTDPEVGFIASDSAILRTVNLTAPSPTWTSITAAPVSGGINDLAIAGGRLLASSQNGQVYRSTNALNAATVTPTWSATGIDLAGFANGLAAVGATGTLMAGSEGLFKTVDITDVSPTWVELGGGLPGSAATDVAVSADGATIYAAAGDSVYRSTNGGISWSERPGIVQGAVHALAASAGRTFAAGEAGLLRSLDGGSSWALVADAEDVGPARAVAVSPLRPDRVFASLGDGVRRSLDGGSTFAPAVATAPSSAALAVDPADPDVVWSVGEFEVVHRSDDGGTTWDDLTAGIPDSFRASEIEIAPASGPDPSVVYLAGDESFVLASANQGQSWTPLGTGLPGGSNDVGDLAVDPTDPQHLYAALDLNGVLYESVNGGATWTATPGTDAEDNPGALDLVQIDTVTFDTDGALLIASGWSFEESGRVYRSDDGGASFEEFGPPMDEVYNDARALLADSQGVHVATGDAGVIDLVRSSDLGVSVAAPVTVAVGKPFSVSVSVTAAGPDPATGVVVTVPRPAGTTLSGSGCTGGATLTCAVDAADGSGSLTLTAVASTTGSRTFTASVEGDQVDPAPGNNTGSDGVSVTKAATRLTLAAEPRRDASAPHSFVLSGTLVRPDGVAPACGGKVKVKITKGTSRVVTKKARLVLTKGVCRYRLPVTFTRRPADRLVATATYAGGPTLAPPKRARTTLRLS